jgi:hypothetical protein
VHLGPRFQSGGERCAPSQKLPRSERRSHQEIGSSIRACTRAHFRSARSRIGPWSSSSSMRSVKQILENRAPADGTLKQQEGRGGLQSPSPKVCGPKWETTRARLTMVGSKFGQFVEMPSSFVFISAYLGIYISDNAHFFNSFGGSMDRAEHPGTNEMTRHGLPKRSVRPGDRRGDARTPVMDNYH